MGRPHRIVFAGATYHVWARGNNKQVIFVDDTDRYAYLTLLAKSARAAELRILAYVLMPNHTHLVVQTRAANLSQAIHQLHGPYAMFHNRRHGRINHLFGNRFRSHLITIDSYLLSVTRYIHRNPVRAGLCAKPEEYPWSSYRAYVETSTKETPVDPEPVLALISSDAIRSRQAYVRFVEAQL